MGCGPQAPPQPEKPKSDPARILLFYSDASQVAKGEDILICYGVEGAASVRLDPPIESITPSFNRCFKYAPAATQEYTLIATGHDGSTARQSFTVRVEGVAQPRAAAAPGSSALIGKFTARPSEIAAGQPVTLCFEAAQADEVSLQPPTGFVGGKLGCFTVQPSATTTYTLTARKGATQSTRNVVVKVR